MSQLGFVLVLGWAGQALAQALQLEPQAPLSLPRAFLNEQISELDRQIGHLLSARKMETNTHRTLALGASVRVRVITRELFAVTDDTAPSSPAMLYGLTLANAMADFDQLFAQLPRLALLVVDRPEASEEERAQFNTLSEVLGRFAHESQEKSLKPAGADWDPIQSYSDRSLSELIPLLTVSGRRAVQPTWFPWADDSSVDQSVWRRSPSAQDLQELLDRLNQVRGAQQARQAMRQTIEAINAAAPFPEFEPRVVRAYHLQNRVLGLLELLDAAVYLSTATRTAMETELGRILTRYLEPTERIDAQGQLETCLQAGRVLQRIHELRRAKAQTDTLETLWGRWVTLMGLADRAAQAHTVLNWLDRVTAIMLQARSMTPTSMAPPIRAAHGRVSLSYAQTERLVLNQAGQMVERPESVNLPQNTTPVAFLRKHAEDLERLVRLPARLEQIRPLRTRIVGGIYQRITAAATQLAVGEDPTAARTLVEFDRQVGRFLDLPGERELRGQMEENDQAQWATVGVMGKPLLILMDRMRAEWANAWAGGVDPPNAGASLEVIHQLMALTRDVESMGEVKIAVQRMNRWAGMEVNPEAIARWIDSVKQELSLIHRLAAEGRIDEVAERLTRLDREWGPVMVIASIHQMVQNRCRELPEGAAGALSQLLYEPQESAWLGDRRTELAIFSRLINELSHRSYPRGGETRGKLLDYCTQVGHRLAERLPIER